MNMDDVLRDMEHSMDLVREWIRKTHRDEELLSAVQNTEGDEDQAFKAKMVMRFMERMEEIGNSVTYLLLPVKVEGCLEIGSDGKFSIGGMPVKTNWPLEYREEGSWELGFVVEDANGKFKLMKDREHSARISTEQLYARVR